MAAEANVMTGFIETLLESNRPPLYYSHRAIAGRGGRRARSSFADRWYPAAMRFGMLAAAAVVLVFAQAARAQTVGVAAGASRQEAGAADLPYLGPPFGGTAPGLIGFVDFGLRNRTSI